MKTWIFALLLFPTFSSAIQLTGAPEPVLCLQPFLVKNLTPRLTQPAAAVVGTYPEPEILLQEAGSTPEIASQAAQTLERILSSHANWAVSRIEQILLTSHEPPPEWYFCVLKGCQVGFGEAHFHLSGLITTKPAAVTVLTPPQDVAGLDKWGLRVLEAMSRYMSLNLLNRWVGANVARRNQGLPFDPFFAQHMLDQKGNIKTNLGTFHFLINSHMAALAAAVTETYYPGDAAHLAAMQAAASERSMLLLEKAGPETQKFLNLLKVNSDNVIKEGLRLSQELAQIIQKTPSP